MKKDGLFELIKVNKEQFETLRAIEQKAKCAVELELRRILGQLGVKVDRDTTPEELTRKMKLASIEILYIDYKKDPKYSGWHIYQHKQPLLIITMRIDWKNQRIHIERHIPRDVGDAISLRSH